MIDNIFGLGHRKYLVKKQWAQLPSFHSLSNISAISNDGNGYIYVLQRDDPFMLIFTPAGELVDEWSNEDITDGHYFRINSEGKVFLTDRDHHRIVILNNKGETIRIIGNAEQPGVFGKPFNHPTDVSFTSSGDIFVSDGYGNAHVHHLDESGNLIRSWGNRGDGKGEFITPHSILVDQSGRVLVADRENNRVQIFKQNGTYLKEINNIYHPMNLYEDKEGFIYVTDQVPTLNVFNSDDEFIGRFRTFGMFGHGVTVDEKGDIYIAEMLPDSITKLTRVD